MTALRAGDVGVDYSGAHLHPARIKADGGRFIVRYSAGAGNDHPDIQWKLCRPGEVAAAEAAGLDFLANSEFTSSRVTEGSHAGTHDGAADLAFWKSRGLHHGAAIYVSWDDPPTHSTWPAVDAYLRAYRAQLHGYYALGAYAGTPYLTHALALGIIQFGWRTNAGSWSNDGLPYKPHNHGRDQLAHALSATPAAIWQTGNYWYGEDADEDLVLRVPCGSHLEAKGGVTPASIDGPVLHRAWPADIPRSEFFGLITGPAKSHGGINASERAAVTAIQQRLQHLGYAPNTPGWADGRFEQPTRKSVAAWQHAHRPGTEFYGEVWHDDWLALFTY